MKPTRPRDLAGAAALGVVLGALILWLFYGSLPPLPVTAPVSLALGAAVEALLAASTRARRAGRTGTRPIPPLLVARYAVLARASGLAGAFAAGGWAGAAGRLLALVARLPAARHDAVIAGAGLACAVLLVVAALRWESACRVDDSDPGAPPAVVHRGAAEDR